MTTEVLRAFHGSQELKDRYLARVGEHAAADRLIRGTGWEDGRGCAVGCTLEAYDHSRYPIELGIPIVLAHLEDRLFERLELSLAMTWPRRFLEAIRPGADLTMVWPRFAVWLLEEECRAWLRPATQGVADCYQRRISGDEPSREEWIRARAASTASTAATATYAAATAASTAAYAAAANASYSASASADAADAAAEVSYKRQATKLLKLLSEAW